MVRIIIALLFCFPAVTFAQTYQQLSERAIECIRKRQSSPGRGTFASGFEARTEKRKECAALF